MLGWWGLLRGSRRGWRTEGRREGIEGVGRRRAVFFRRRAVPRRRGGEGWVVRGRKVVRGVRRVWGGGVVR